MNTIKERIAKIIEICELYAAENKVLSGWYKSTADAAKGIGEMVENSITEFENISLALSALKSDVAMITVDDLASYEQFDHALEAYDADDTIYGKLVSQSKDAIKEIAYDIIGSTTNLSILESALGMRPVNIPENDNDRDDNMSDEECENIAQEIDKESSEIPDDIDDDEYPDDDDFEEAEEADEADEDEYHEELSLDIPDADSIDLYDEPEPVQEPAENEPTMFGVPLSKLIEGTSAEEAAKIEASVRESNPVYVSNHPKKIDTPNRFGPVPAGFSELMIPGFEDHRFIVSAKNTIVDRASGHVVKPYPIRGTEYVSLKHDDGNSESFELVALLASATDRSSIQNTNTAQSKSKEEDPEDEFVYIDWIEGIPAGKYKVFKSGKVYDTVHEQFIPYDRKYETVRLSAGDVESRTPGVSSFTKTLKRQSLVFQAFHPSFRGRSHIYVSFINGNRQDCSLANLYSGRSRR